MNNRAIFGINAAIYNIRRWSRSPRVLLLTILSLVITMIYVQPYIANARLLNEPVGIFEAFILLMNHKFSLLLFSSIVLLIFCDIPLQDSMTQSTVMKGSRVEWISAQVGHVVFFSVFLTFCLLLICIMMSSTFSYLGDEWSYSAKLMGLTGKMKIAPSTVFVVPDRAILTKHTPYEAAAYSFALFTLLSILYGELVMLVNLRAKNGSQSVLLIINLVAWMGTSLFPSSPLFVFFSWASPQYHGSLFTHYILSGNRATQPMLVHSLNYFAILITLCTIALIATYKTYDINRNSAEEGDY